MVRSNFRSSSKARQTAAAGNSLVMLRLYEQAKKPPPVGSGFFTISDRLELGFEFDVHAGGDPGA